MGIAAGDALEKTYLAVESIPLPGGGFAGLSVLIVVLLSLSRRGQKPRRQIVSERSPSGRGGREPPYGFSAGCARGGWGRGQTLLCRTLWGRGAGGGGGGSRRRWVSPTPRGDIFRRRRRQHWRRSRRQPGSDRHDLRPAPDPVGAGLVPNLARLVEISPALRPLLRNWWRPPQLVKQLAPHATRIVVLWDPVGLAEGTRRACARRPRPRVARSASTCIPSRSALRRP